MKRSYTYYQANRAEHVRRIQSRTRVKSIRLERAVASAMPLFAFVAVAVIFTLLLVPKA